MIRLTLSLSLRRSARYLTIQASRDRNPADPGNRTARLPSPILRPVRAEDVLREAAALFDASWGKSGVWLETEMPPRGGAGRGLATAAKLTVAASALATSGSEGLEDGCDAPSEEASVTSTGSAEGWWANVGDDGWASGPESPLLA